MNHSYAPSIIAVIVQFFTIIYVTLCVGMIFREVNSELAISNDLFYALTIAIGVILAIGATILVYRPLKLDNVITMPKVNHTAFDNEWFKQNKILKAYLIGGYAKDYLRNQLHRDPETALFEDIEKLNEGKILIDYCEYQHVYDNIWSKANDISAVNQDFKRLFVESLAEFFVNVNFKSQLESADYWDQDYVNFCRETAKSYITSALNKKENNGLHFSVIDVIRGVDRNISYSPEIELMHIASLDHPSSKHASIEGVKRLLKLENPKKKVEV